MRTEIFFSASRSDAPLTVTLSFAATLIVPFSESCAASADFFAVTVALSIVTAPFEAETITLPSLAVTVALFSASVPSIEMLESVDCNVTPLAASSFAVLRTLTSFLALMPRLLSASSSAVSCIVTAPSVVRTEIFFAASRSDAPLTVTLSFAVTLIVPLSSCVVPDTFFASTVALLTVTAPF